MLQLAPPELVLVPLHDTAESLVHIPVCVYCGCWIIKTSRAAGSSGDFTVKPPVESRASDWVIQDAIKLKADTMMVWTLFMTTCVTPRLNSSCMCFWDMKFREVQLIWTAAVYMCSSPCYKRVFYFNTNFLHKSRTLFLLFRILCSPSLVFQSSYSQFQN